MPLRASMHMYVAVNTLIHTYTEGLFKMDTDIQSSALHHQHTASLFFDPVKPLHLDLLSMVA